ncbi:unnamed protein product, partial [Schistosoma turkestanicum]
DQQPIEKSNVRDYISPPSSGKVNQSLIDLTLVSEDQLALSSFTAINASLPPTTGCSLDTSKTEPVFEMNLPIDPTTSIIAHPDDVNCQLKSGISNPNVSILIQKSDSHHVKKISAMACTSMSSSKSHGRNESSTSFNQNRHQQAHANRQRVKEFDRIHRERLMKQKNLNRTAV